MDISLFKELFISITQISQLDFEVWDDDGRVFSSRPDGSDMSIYRQLENFSKQVISHAVFRNDYFNGQQSIFGVPMRDEERVIGALLAYNTKAHKRLKQKAGDSRKRPPVKEMKKLLTRLAAVMEDKWLDAKERDSITEELSRSFEDLHLYSKIGGNVKSLIYSNSMHSNMVEEILKTMRVDIAFIKMINNDVNNVFIEKPNSSVKTPDMELFVERLLKHISLESLTSEQNYWLIDNSHTKTEYRELHIQPFRFLAVKISQNDKFYGWLGILSFNMKETFRRSEMRLLASIAEQLAIVLANTKLYNDLEVLVNNLIKSMVLAVEAKDIYTSGHSERVCNICMYIAEHVGLGKEEKNNLLWASVLHDVGKIGVPEFILNKQGHLSDDEYKIIKEHPQRGFDILQPIVPLKNAIAGILHHHERYDGRGFPHGLRGEEIPLYARVIAVADTYDAITSNRAYRPAKGKKEALAIIDNVVGVQLDPYLVSVFKKVCKKEIDFRKKVQPFHVEITV